MPANPWFLCVLVACVPERSPPFRDSLESTNGAQVLRATFEPEALEEGDAALDESGRALPAWMEETDDGLRLVVDDADASGTVTVDPLLELAWTAESDQELAYFGSSVSSAGDVNGDGYGDVVVGAFLYDNGEADEGRAYLYLGSAAGLETTAAWTAEPDWPNVWFGYSVSSAGDVNGDGYGDVVVGAPYYGNGEDDEGRASLYLGSAAGLDTTPAWVAESNQILGVFGFSVSSAGDVNGDGYGDVVVGAPGSSNGQTFEGRAYLYLGSAAGLETTPAWAAEPDWPSAWFGSSVSSAGDVNGDGYGDVVVGAYLDDNGESDEGRAYLYLGSAAGLDTTAAWVAESNQVGGVFGFSVSSAGDVNGDGYGDVVVGALYDDNGQADEGRASLYLGSAAGLATTAAWTAESNQVSAGFGSSVSSAGDMNGDGYGDVVVGAFEYDNGQVDEGRASLYLGSPAGLETTAAWSAASDQVGAWFGQSVSSAGDVNGDGYGDVVVGAYLYDEGSKDEGRAYLYEGACDADADGACGIEDCDDTDATVYPGAPELCDRLDNACAGSVPADEMDVDLDGALGCAGDCDDNDPTSYLGAPELCDGIDNACAGSVPADEMDADRDGWSACAGDCDDADLNTNPNLTEVCGDDVDNDCDGVVDQTCGARRRGCDGTSGTIITPLAILAALLVSMLRRKR